MTSDQAATRPLQASYQLGHGAGGAIAAAIYAVSGGMGVMGALATDAAPVNAVPIAASAFSLFTHNLGVLVWLSLGLVTAGLVTLATMCLNGMILGWVVGKMLLDDQGAALVTGLLPHLPFELGAYLCSSAATIRVGLALATRLLTAGRHAPPVVWPRWLLMQGVAVLLLATGAVVERYVSHV